MNGPSRPKPTLMPSREQGIALFTDLYELTMLQAYRELGLAEREAVFSLFVRRLPPERNFLIACGLDRLLGELEALRFGPGDIEYLAAQGFKPDFLDWLAAFRFTGTVHALPEGTPFFANEPVLEVIAPIGAAQLIETLAINRVGFETIIASKAARVLEAAAGRPVIDFGGRRAQGHDAAIEGARAAFVGGAAATSNVLAGRLYGIPVAGTMAHSFVQAFTDEMDAFRAFARIYPDTTLLVDTYDTVEGVGKVIALAREMGAAFRVRAVRLDSGDLLALSQEARRLLDEAGLATVQIFASGGLDERKIARLMVAGAPIDGFGVGTDMMVSADAPALDIVYKLTEFAGEGRMKLSARKRTLPGRKQVFRTTIDGTAEGDMIARYGEPLPGEPLLAPVMRDGVRLEPSPPLPAVQARARAEIARLPRALRALEPAAEPYLVAISPALQEYAAEVREKIAAQSVQPKA